MSAAQIGMSMKQKRDAERGMETLKAKQDATPLRNAYAGMQVSTLGADRQLEQSQRDVATGVEAISSAGSRGLSYLSEVMDVSSNIDQNVGANLDAQATDIAKLQAGDKINMRNLQEQRFMAEAQGYATLYAAGQSGMESGIASAGNALAVGATAWESSQDRKAVYGNGNRTVEMNSGGGGIDPNLVNPDKYAGLTVDYTPSWYKNNPITSPVATGAPRTGN